jgi:hypothetical protein
MAGPLDAAGARRRGNAKPHERGRTRLTPKRRITKRSQKTAFSTLKTPIRRKKRTQTNPPGNSEWRIQNGETVAGALSLYAARYYCRASRSPGFQSAIRNPKSEIPLIPPSVASWLRRFVACRTSLHVSRATLHTAPACREHRTLFFQTEGYPLRSTMDEEAHWMVPRATVSPLAASPDVRRPEIGLRSAKHLIRPERTHVPRLRCRSTVDSRG